MEDLLNQSDIYIYKYLEREGNLIINSDKPEIIEVIKKLLDKNLFNELMKCMNLNPQITQVFILSNNAFYNYYLKTNVYAQNTNDRQLLNKISYRIKLSINGNLYAELKHRNIENRGPDFYSEYSEDMYNSYQFGTLTKDVFNFENSFKNFRYTMDSIYEYINKNAIGFLKFKYVGSNLIIQAI